MSQPTYIVKKDDGVIICKITTQGNEVFKYLSIPSMYKKLKKRFNIGYIDDELEFTTVVRHHKSDVWNETLGKHIAESKCKKKIYNFYKRLYKFILDEIVRIDIEDMTRYIDNLTFCELREEKHFKDLIEN
jgi:hypothetical protein